MAEIAAGGVLNVRDLNYRLYPSIGIKIYPDKPGLSFRAFYHPFKYPKDKEKIFIRFGMAIGKSF